MSTDDEKIIKRRARSPAYPAISLRQALELVRKVWEAQRKAEAHIDSTLHAMGYAKHGASLRMIAALGHYGLIDESGSADSRKIRVSEIAQDILHLQESDPRRQAALKDAALHPVIHATLWERYGKLLPENSSIRPFLVREKGFNEDVVEEVIQNYRESFELAGLDKDGDHNVGEKNVTPMTPLAPNPTKTTPPAGQQAPGGGFGIISQNELPILIGDNRQARIPFPMTEEDYDLLLETLAVWKKRLVRKAAPEQQDEKTFE